MTPTSHENSDRLGEAGLDDHGGDAEDIRLTTILSVRGSTFSPRHTQASLKYRILTFTWIQNISVDLAYAGYGKSYETKVDCAIVFSH